MFCPLHSFRFSEYASQLSQYPDWGASSGSSCAVAPSIRERSCIISKSSGMTPSMSLLERIPTRLPL